MKIGKKTFIARGIKFDFPWRISIGENCYISHGVYLDGRGGVVRIGNSVDISAEALVFSLSHNIYDNAFSTKKGSVEIADRTWICTRAIVLPNSIVRTGSVIGAASVIGGITDPFGLYAGNPAQKIKCLPDSRASSVRNYF